MSTWAPNVSRVIDNGFGSSRGGLAVVGCIPHHVAGPNGRDYVANWNDRNSHPTYHIDRHGIVTGIVHPDRRPTSTYPGDIDKQAVTVEIDNIVIGKDWDVALPALLALAIIIRHHADESPRRGNAIVANDPNVVQKGFFVGRHDQYRAVECPGPMMRRELPGVIENANGNPWAAVDLPKPPVTVPAGNAGGTSAVRRGEKSERVRWIQQRLQAHDRYKGYTVDDDFGGVTESELIAFQKANGLRPDGWLTWGSGQTYDALAKAPARPSSATGLVIKVGTNHPNVGKWQRFMNDNYPAYAKASRVRVPLAIDNAFGAKQSKLWLQEFQRRVGLDPDGWFTWGSTASPTWNALVRAGLKA